MLAFLDESLRWMLWCVALICIAAVALGAIGAAERVASKKYECRLQESLERQQRNNMKGTPE